MKILMATMAMDIGGAETHIVELCRELRHHDHTIIVASAGGVYVPQLEEAGILHITVPMKRRNLKDMISSYRILKSIIKEHSPDVVHAHARIPAFLCGILQKKLHFPFVTTAHGVFRTGGGLRYLTNWGEGVIAVSEDIKTYLIEEYHYPADKISLTINGIDTQAFSSQTPPDPTYQRTGNNLCHVSRLDKDPAIVGKYLIDLAPDLATVIPNFSLLIVGGGDQLELMKEQAKRANDKIGRECVLLTGASTKVNEQIMLGDLFVGISRCALEAMASEKTVILAGIAGYQGILTPEGLQEATEGNFCCRGMTPLTKDLLKEGILQGFALTQEERATLGTFGRQVIEEHYSVGRMANDYLARYQDAITPQYKVVISGYYGFENAGDDAILQSIHHQINSATQKEQVEITVLSNNPRATTEHYGLTAVHRLHIPAVIRAISASDALLSGGGSLIQDRTSTRSLLYYLSIISLADHLRKPIMLYANGIGPVDKPYNRKRVKKVLDRATVITLRDQDSANELAAIGVDQKEIKVTADPVLNMIPAGHNRAEELIQELGITDEFFVVSVRNWKGKPTLAQEIAILCDHIATTHHLTPLFVLMQPKIDRQPSQSVQRLMKTTSYLLETEVTPREIMAVIQKSKCCLAMRLHTLIFSAGVGIPLLGMVYDPKVESYLKELQMPSLGSTENFQSAHAIKVADELFEHYETYRELVIQQGGILSEKAKQNEATLLEMLHRNNHKTQVGKIRK